MCYTLVGLLTVNTKRYNSNTDTGETIPVVLVTVKRYNTNTDTGETIPVVLVRVKRYTMGPNGPKLSSGPVSLECMNETL